LIAIAAGTTDELVVPRLGRCSAISTSLDHPTYSSLVVARTGTGDFSHEEMNLLRGMGHVLMLTLRMLRMIGKERSLREELVERQRARLESERQARLILDGAHDAFIAIDEHSRIVDWNRQAEIMFGRTRDEVLGLPVSGLIMPERYREAHAAGVRRYLATGVGKALNRPMELAALRADSSEFPIEVTIWPVEVEGPIRFGAFIRDLTERKVAQERQRRLAAIIEATSDIAAICEPDGRCIFLNRAGRTLLGFGEDEEISSLYIYDHRPAHEVVRIKSEAIPAAISNGSWSGESLVTSPEGVDIPVSQMILSHTDSENRVEFLSAIARDLSEHKVLEAQLRQAQKMDAVGQLAGGVAHDFNNLLSVIQNYSDFVLQDLDRSDPRREDVEEIRRAGERATVLTRQLLAFSRQEVTRPEVIDINKLIVDFQKILSRTIVESIELYLNLTSEPWHVEIDRGQAEQVLMNLAVNAKDAMPRGGSLVIKTANVTVDNEITRGHPGLVSGRYLCLSVSDTGLGMSDEVQRRIFEPFYTTKPRESGTGLGLATVYGIVKQAGGYIKVDSEPGNGTTFKILLPAVLEVATERASRGRPAGSSGAGELVLVVDDEDAIRKLIQRVLKATNYEVLVAASGPDALEMVTQLQHPPDLLLTDVVMPRMSGRELADRLRESNPRIRTLFMSGYPDKIIAAHGALTSEQEYLQKPFDSAELLAAIHSALSSEPLEADRRASELSPTGPPPRRSQD
jgi:PAS domain S-box-containing protein